MKTSASLEQPINLENSRQDNTAMTSAIIMP